MGQSHPYLSILLCAAVMAAAFAIVWKIGVIPTRFFGCIRRSEEPETFTLSLAMSAGFVAVLLIMMTFVTWAEKDSDALTAAYLKSLHDGAEPHAR